MTQSEISLFAQQYRDEGLSVIPVGRDDGTPSVDWTRYQMRPADDAELARWFQDDENNIAVVTGGVSGNLHIVGFDGDGWELARDDFLRAFPDLAGTRLIQSGTGRLSILLQVDDPLDTHGEPVTKLVFARPDLGQGTQIEILGNGCYTHVPPSRYPDGGKCIFLHANDIVVFDSLTPLIEWLGDWRDRRTARLTRRPTADIPSLSRDALVPEELGADACPWLDSYIAFSRRWSPRSYDGYHEAFGIWMLSVVAGRRVEFNFGGPKYTSLYLALIGKSGVEAKTTGAQLGRGVLAAAQLDWLLAPNEATPQKFIFDMTARVPPDYGSASESKRRRIRDKLAMAGKCGWYYDEFGQKLAGILNERGPMADFHGIFRLFWDCPLRYEYGTISRGTDLVEKPYLSLLANMTQADLRKAAIRGSNLWSDGFFARFAMICPPLGRSSRARYPRERFSVPREITQPLIDWHNRLGMPEVTVVQHTKDSDTSAGEYEAELGPFHPEVLDYTDEVYQAYYTYKDALADFVDDEVCPEDLFSNMVRLPDMAFRVSALLCSVAGQDVIEIKHWARAQAIAERWRAGLHEVYTQVNGPGSAKQQAEKQLTAEDKVVRVLTRLGGHRTATQMARFISTMNSQKVADICDRLCHDGILVATEANRTVYYDRP